MKTTTLLLVLGLIAPITGCAQSYTPMDSPGYDQRLTIEESLFPEDTKLISNEAIREILDGKIDLPDRSNIAVLQLGPSSFYQYGNEAVYLATIFSQLKNCGRVDQITQIPDILIPRKTLTVSSVREAAARLQCELVLIYRIDHNVRYKHKWLGRDTSKVYSSVNGMLLHTRTGIVPFTTVVDQEYKTVEKKSGETTQEFHQRTRHEATLGALQKLGTELAAFLSSIK